MSCCHWASNTLAFTCHISVPSLDCGLGVGLSNRLGFRGIELLVPGGWGHLGLERSRHCQAAAQVGLKTCWRRVVRAWRDCRAPPRSWSALGRDVQIELSVACSPASAPRSSSVATAPVHAAVWLLCSRAFGKALGTSFALWTGCPSLFECCKSSQESPSCEGFGSYRSCQEMYLGAV